MTPKVTVDTRDFIAAMRNLRRVSSATIADILNQSIYDVAWEAAMLLRNSDGGPQMKRQSIRGYMWQQLLSHITIIKNKKSANYGKYTRRGRLNLMPGRRGYSQQLHRVHLIVQAKRRKEGKPGHYGRKMAKAAGRFAGSAQNAVKYLTVPFKDVLYNLNAYVKYRKSHRIIWGKNAGISLWPRTGARGHGIPAVKLGANNPWSEMSTRWNLRKNAQYAVSLINQALAAAVAFKRDKLERDAKRRFEEALNRPAGTPLKWRGL